MFIDQVGIEIKAGDGGRGIVAFRREAMVEMGGPFGGSGGRGGNVTLIVDEGLRTLLDFSYNKKYKAQDGRNGMSKGKTGAYGNDLVLRVPPGTVVYNDDTNEFLGDLVYHEDELVIVKGGRGGRGNVALAKAGKHQLEICENGEPGDTKNIRLELKLLADVGLVGLPSVGKSTLISVISKVKPKIAAYHFTTIVPNLGVVKVDNEKSFVVADLPGLIEGASQGKGLGHQFLRHVERTKLILHILDMGAVEYRDPIEDYEKINKELESYKLNLLKKPQIVVANKMDVPEAYENLIRFKEKFPDIEVIEVSAVTNTGLEPLKHIVSEKLENILSTYVAADEAISKTYKFVDEKLFHIFRDAYGQINVDGPAIVKLVAMTNFGTLDNTRRFGMQLKSLGVYEQLREFGIEDGEHVRVQGFEFQYE